MNKKLFASIIAVTLLLSGCGAKNTKNAVKPAVKPNNNSSQPAADSSTSKSAGTSQDSGADTKKDSINYSQYVKKTWVDKNGTNNASFCISKIAGGKITGGFTSIGPAVSCGHAKESLTGTINNGTAQCQFKDSAGNKGNMKLTFISGSQIKVTIKLVSKSQHADELPKEGTFDFVSYNINSIKGLKIIKDQSFTVNLNSWGNVRFISGKLTAGNHVPVVFYLADKSGNILYDFQNGLPYSVDVKAVSFADVNKDSLKDVIVIVGSSDGANVANVYFQKSDGSFAEDTKLDMEMNNSGNNKDIKTVRNYLSKKF